MAENGPIDLRARVHALEQELEVLRRREQSYRSLIDNASDLIVKFDGDQRLLFVSPSYCRTFGVEAEAILGSVFFPLVHPDDVATVKASIATLPLPPHQTYHEERAKTPHGWRWFGWSLQAEVDDTGKVVQVVSTGRDITDLKRFADAETHYSAMFETAAFGIVVCRPIFDEAGRFIDFEHSSANPATETHTGFPLDQIVGKRASDMLDDEELPTVLDLYRPVVEGGKHIHYEQYFELYERTLRVGSSRLSDSRFSISFIDVSDRIRANEDLRKRDKLLETIYESMGDFLIVLDLEHRIEFMNRAGRGIEKEHLYGTPLYSLVVPEDSARVKAHLDRVVQETIPQSYSTAFLDQDGELTYFSALATPILMDGVNTGTVVTSRDITAQLKLEQDKQQLEEQIRQSQRMESLGVLAGGIAHDFNNLLTVINGYARLVEDRLEDDTPLKGKMGHILDAGRRAGALTRQLLTFCRKEMIDIRVLDLNQVLAKTEHILTRIIGEDIELTIDLGEDCGLVRADEGQLEQILMNLAINARDAMPHGGTLFMGTKACLMADDGGRDKRYTQLEVRDSGRGIPEEIQHRIFEPFFSTKPRGQGTGLGLSTVYGIVTQCAGKLQLDSHLGQGSTFRILLPVAEGSIRARQEHAHRNTTEGDECILLVEDEQAVRSLTRGLLQSAGYHVISAANGAEALDRFRDTDETISLVVTDVIMPGMSGSELSKLLLHEQPHLKILFMSGYTDDTIRDRGGLERGVRVLNKPFEVDALLEAVRDTLDDSIER